MKNSKYVIKRNGERFIIENLAGEIIDNAQGYCYKTYKSAISAATYKFGGGRNKEIISKNKIKEWKKENIDLYKTVEEDMSYMIERWIQEYYSSSEIKKELLKYGKEKNIPDFIILSFFKKK